MKKISMILSFLTIILGAVAAFLGSADTMGGATTLALMGGAIAFVGVAILACVFMYPDFGSSTAALIVSLLATAGGALFAIEMIMRPTQTGSSILLVLGPGLALLNIILCPCMCMQGGRQSRSSVVGVASAHESITISEISRKTGVPEDVASKIVYDAIGKGQLSGRMDGNTFKRTGPATGISPDAKVLVICPYCGAKTEQGLAKCQNCSADL